MVFCVSTTRDRPKSVTLMAQFWSTSKLAVYVGQSIDETKRQ